MAKTKTATVAKKTAKTKTAPRVGDRQFIRKLSAGQIATALGIKLREFVSEKSPMADLMQVGCIVERVDFIQNEKGDSVCYHGNFTAKVSPPISGNEPRFFVSNRAFFPTLVDDQFMATFQAEMMETAKNPRSKSVYKTMAFTGDIANAGGAQFAVGIGVKYNPQSAVGYEYSVNIRDTEQRELPPSANLLELLQ